VTLSDALEDIEIAFKQLEFTIKLLSFCELGNIKPSEFDTDHIINLEGGRIRFPTGNFSEIGNIINAASVSVLIAFSASVLVLDKAFEIMGMKPDPESVDAVTCLRTLIYMLRCAQAHGVADPRWEVRGKYLCALSLNLGDIALSLNLSKLNGERFDIDQIGGYPNWYQIRHAAVRVLTSAMPST
jgi:hypothetical protein